MLLVRNIGEPSITFEEAGSISALLRKGDRNWLSSRVKLLEDELERLSQYKDVNRELVHEKEAELRAMRQKAEELTKQVLLAQEMLNDFLCLHCGAPLAVR